MTSRPRSDLYVNLPALRKLDNMLLVRFLTLICAKLDLGLETNQQCSHDQKKKKE